ncbi:HAMP domain-containing protein [Proteus myxofaciens]|uniref:YhjK family protein n=1 Tax=Proteus myxofaciens ATCC 19692 TaxID=1354337 RepID=A0A198G1E3_9GAMM|nr:HAMP domain-containing protein [Proteus myxofaciens]OAT30933.1 YhjK family protein [Proteus myxofaciens ATCC 19692]
MKPHLKRSLTIKQMAAVAGVTLVTIAIFISIQLVYLIDQRREDYQNQLFNAGMSIQQSLADALLRSDLNDAKQQIISLKTTGILGKAIVIQPENLQILNLDFAPKKEVSPFSQWLFHIPVEVTIPLHPLGVVYTEDKAYTGRLILQADTNRVYRFASNTVALVLTTYLLMGLILTIAISWCINRIVVKPLRKIAVTLNEEDKICTLTCPKSHHDDEIGLLVKGYNHQKSDQKLPKV